MPVPTTNAPHYFKCMNRVWTLGLLLPLALTACSASNGDEMEGSDQTPISCEPDCDTAFENRGEFAAGYQVVDVDGLTIKAWYHKYTIADCFCKARIAGAISQLKAAP